MKCESCSSGIYVGEGDFFCEEHTQLSIEDWSPTDCYFNCEREEENCEL